MTFGISKFWCKGTNINKDYKFINLSFNIKLSISNLEKQIVIKLLAMNTLFS